MDNFPTKTIILLVISLLVVGFFLVIGNKNTQQLNSRVIKANKPSHENVAFPSSTMDVTGSSTFPLVTVPSKRQFCRQIDNSLERARSFFRKSLEESYNRVLSMKRPIQVDLYILVHYLMYQDKLGFIDDPEDAERWKRLISDYFLKSFGRGIWEREGCLAVKGLIGLESGGEPWKKIKPVADYYYRLIQKQWDNDGVGECFSTKIERTFGSDEDIPCSGVTDELNAKVLYYKTTTKFKVDNPMMKVATFSLNDGSPRILKGWWDILPEMWVLRTYREHDRLNNQAKKGITENRFLTAVKSVTDTVRGMNISEKRITANSLDLLLYSYLMAHQKVDDYATLMALQIIKSQEPSGRFAVDFGGIDIPDSHNVYATPVYFSLLALSEYQKLEQCRVVQ